MYHNFVSINYFPHIVENIKESIPVGCVLPADQLYLLPDVSTGGGGVLKFEQVSMSPEGGVPVQ